MARDAVMCEAEAPQTVRSQTEVWERGQDPRFEIEETRILWTCRPSEQWVNQRLYRYGMLIVVSAVFVAAFMLIVPAAIRWGWLIVWAFPALLLRAYYSGILRRLWRTRATSVEADRLTGMICCASSGICRLPDVVAVELALVPADVDAAINVRLHLASGHGPARLVLGPDSCGCRTDCAELE